MGAVSFGFLYAPPVARLAAELRARRSALFETTPIAVSIPTSTASSTSTSTLRRSHQGRVGALLALLLLTAWALTLHHGLFVHQWGLASIGWAAAVVVFMCWLDVGLFIVAHDAMHGSLVPHHARLNSALGRLCMALYAGFTLGRFKPRHFEHHRHPGTANDPDFHAQAKHFWPWYVSFMRRYFGWREALGLLVLFTVLSVVLRAPVLHVLVFWALPALLSSVQLFAFGTWLPHRAGPVPFVDHHHARSNPFGWCVSLLTCFHFGYHHEHHTHPHEPWWRLPSVRGSVHPKSHQQPHGSRPRATSGTTPRATPQKTPP